MRKGGGAGGEKQKEIRKTSAPSSSSDHRAPPPGLELRSQAPPSQGPFVYVLHKLAALQRQRKHHDCPQTSG